MTSMANRQPRDPRSRNVRTAAALLSIALVFFIGVILAHAVGIGDAGLTALGLLIFVFLVVAIGRNLFNRR
ncbi:MAG TPA: hypothetical protein VFC24_16645 [Casimicrobiaceae bacterium]|nr:hypothetical protein [Casimicrobiaceae bacterium]